MALRRMCISTMKTVFPAAKIIAVLSVSERLDCNQRLERERIHLSLIDEIGKGLDDVAVGRVRDARQAIQRFKHR